MSFNKKFVGKRQIDEIEFDIDIQNKKVEIKNEAKKYSQ